MIIHFDNFRQIEFLFVWIPDSSLEQMQILGAVDDTVIKWPIDNKIIFYWQRKCDKSKPWKRLNFFQCDVLESK